MNFESLTQAVSALTLTLLIPVLFSVWLASGQYRKLFRATGKISAIFVFLSIAAIVACLVLVAPWAVGVYWARYVVAVLLVIGVVRFPFEFAGVKSESGGFFARLSQGIIIVIGAVFAAGAVWAGSAYAVRDGVDRIELQFPLKGRMFVIGQGGDAIILNGHHGHPAQRYALDIIAINAAGHNASVLFPDSADDYVVWSAEVISPCDGEVVWARDGLEDAPGAQRDRDTPAGNVVAIDCGDATVFLAHLQNSSVAVSEGQRLSAGDHVGLVGNSGNTTEPHLHFHAEAGPFQGEQSENPGVPIVFEGRFLVRNDLVRR